jgi:hypothetical protein
MYSDYSKIPTTEPDAAEKLGLNIDEMRNDPNMRKATFEELQSVERWLDVRPGILSDGEFWSTRITDKQGLEVGLVEIVLTALIDAGHSKSFVLHTLLGNKLIVTSPRPVRTLSGEWTDSRVNYSWYGDYWCIIPPGSHPE